MSGKARRKLGGWHISLGARLFGYYAQLAFYPLGAWRRLWLVAPPQNSMTTAWHLMVGPFHAHGYYLGWKLIELEIDVAHDPFWGSTLKAPAHYRVLIGSPGALSTIRKDG